MVKFVRDMSSVVLVWAVLLLIVIALLFVAAFYGNPVALPKLSSFFAYAGGTDMLLFAAAGLGLLLRA